MRKNKSIVTLLSTVTIIGLISVELSKSVSAKVSAIVVTRTDGKVYEYDYSKLKTSAVAAALNSSSPEANLYNDFLSRKTTIKAYYDDVKNGYVDAAVVREAAVNAKLTGASFKLDDFTSASSTATTSVTASKVATDASGKITVDGIVEESQSNTNNIIVTFKDKNLEQAVRDTINKPTGDICKSDVEKITELNAVAKEIKDISGIEKLINLRDLGLSLNQISNINPLSGLSNLLYLRLDINQISNIDSLSALTNLQVINLQDNQISDINALNGLTNLSYLNLAQNQISDVNALSKLTNLQQLGLHSNQISDVSALSGLTNLQKLYLSKNQISDYSPLKGYYGNLKDRDFQLSNSTDTTDTIITFKDTNLEQVVRERIGKPTGDIYKSDVQGITSLDASSNCIYNISGIENLTSLQTLFLRCISVNDIIPSKELDNLQKLYLTYTFMRDSDKQLLERALPKCDILYGQIWYKKIIKF